MQKSDFRAPNVLNFYQTLSILKETERTGWQKWNIIGRRESINDHTTSCQHLAFALYSEYDINVNIEHVILLLSIHEIGESIIGDITRYDGISASSKSECEKAAVAQICAPLNKGNILLSLFYEFEAKETPEAKFAFLCDKLDCDLQAWLYSKAGRCSIENATYERVSIKEILEIIENGAKTVFDVFWESDKALYEGTYLESFFAMLKNM